MDVRLTSEQQQLREAAAKLADDLGPGSVADLDDASRIARLEKAVDATGFRTLRSDGASGVEVAIVAEEFARGLVDVPFLGPVLADDLRRALGREPSAPAAGARVGRPDEKRLPEWSSRRPSSASSPTEDAGRWHALALAVTCADLVGAARGTHALAVRVREGPRAVRRNHRVLSGRRAPAGREPGADRGVDQRAAPRRVGRRRTARRRGDRGRRGWPRSTVRVRH